jgi:hypothetical protein
MFFTNKEVDANLPWGTKVRILPKNPLVALLIFYQQ